MFGFPVELSKHDWPFRAEYVKEEIIALLNEYWSPLSHDQKPYNFYKLSRLGYGLVKHVVVLEVPFAETIGYYTIRCHQQPEEDITEGLNLAAYKKQRTEQLIQALGDHYPPTMFINSTKYIIQLQQFLFYPVCEFNDLVDFQNLLDIIYLASNSRILLDYNHNHWLRSDVTGCLYYCDGDFMGNFYPSQYQALEANLNQSMTFLTTETIKLHLQDALMNIRKVSNAHADFSEQVKKSFRDLVRECLSREMSDTLKNKILSLNDAVKD